MSISWLLWNPIKVKEKIAEIFKMYLPIILLKFQSNILKYLKKMKWPLSFSTGLTTATENETAIISSRAEMFGQRSGDSLHITGSTWMSEVSAWRVGDANASALICGGRKSADVVAIEIAFPVPAIQTVVTNFPVASGHRCHWWHGRNQQNNRWNLHPVSINQTKS